MDSVSHTTVAHYLLDYVETTNGVSFNRKAFMFGNLKPDLKGEYLTKRHYPSLMFEEVMQRIRDFIAHVRLNASNGPKISEDLGVICHFQTGRTAAVLCKRIDIARKLIGDLPEIRAL